MGSYMGLPNVPPPMFSIHFFTMGVNRGLNTYFLAIFLNKLIKNPNNVLFRFLSLLFCLTVNIYVLLKLLSVVMSVSR